MLFHVEVTLQQGYLPNILQGSNALLQGRQTFKCADTLILSYDMYDAQIRYDICPGCIVLHYICLFLKIKLFRLRNARKYFELYLLVMFTHTNNVLYIPDAVNVLRMNVIYSYCINKLLLINLQMEGLFLKLNCNIIYFYIILFMTT